MTNFVLANLLFIFLYFITLYQLFVDCRRFFLHIKILFDIVFTMFDVHHDSLVEKLTNFFKQLHSSKSNKLLASGRTLKAEIKISASDKKKKRS